MCHGLPTITIYCCLEKIIFCLVEECGTPGGAVGLGTVLPVGRLWVGFPMVWLEFFIDNPSGRTMSLGSTQRLAEMSTRIISWGAKFVHLVGLTTLLSLNLGTSTFWNFPRLSRPVAGLLQLFYWRKSFSVKLYDTYIHIYTIAVATTV
jgi:hypothetical protein